MSNVYWLDLFTGKTWGEFLKAGGKISGFRESRWKTVKRIKPGDRFLCYLTGVSRFIAVLEITSEGYKDDSKIWEDEPFPCRLGVKTIVRLTPETAVPVQDLRGKISIFENLKNPHAWTGKVRGSPAKWKTSDGETILNRLLQAQENPVVRPVDPKKLARRPRAIATEAGPVTVPEEDEASPTQTHETPDATSSHTEIQFLLLQLGVDLGFKPWVARNDRNRSYKKKALSDHFSFEKKLPVQFDEATTRTIEYIDVLWLQGNAIVAAFEVESTTSIYSGLLRMSDLISMQPNISMPLYLVAPDERRDKVFLEVNRPTFSKLSPPLAEVCRFIAFTTLRKKIGEIAPLVRYLKPEFLEELSEFCQVDEA